jgi:hypothetical protein
MAQLGLTTGKFVARIVIAILVSSVISIGVSTMLRAGPQGPEGPQGETGRKVHRDRRVKQELQDLQEILDLQDLLGQREQLDQKGQRVRRVSSGRMRLIMIVAGWT